MSTESLFFVGTYTTRGSLGIYTVTLDVDSGKMEEIFVDKSVSDPSFLKLNPKMNRLYAVSEVTDPVNHAIVSAFNINTDGSLKFSNSESTVGIGSCHINIDSSGSNIIVANYHSGSVCLLPLGSDGELFSHSDFHQHIGSSSETNGSLLSNQQGPHAHSISIDINDRFVYVCDLGKDMIVVYEIDFLNKKLIERDELNVMTDKGEGPRHFDFHPNLPYAYVINEIGSTVSVYDYNLESGQLKQKQKISTLPDNFSQTNSTADVHVSKDGKFLYGSNRGHDSIAIFRINQNTGILEHIENQTTMGHTPRNFSITPDESMILVANQDSGDIFSFHRDRTSGLLEFTGNKLDIPAPVCIQFMGKNN